MSKQQRGVDPLAGAEWARHSRGWWQQRAEDGRVDVWLRLVALAYAQHGNNGHATFARTELGKLLGTDGGTIPRQRLHEHIKTAISLGFLEPGSTSMCLVVPFGGIDKGPIGAPKPACKVHSRRLRAQVDRNKASADHARPPDTLLKASGLGRDTLNEVSADHTGSPDASRSGSISYNYPSPALPPAEVRTRREPPAEQEVSA